MAPVPLTPLHHHHRQLSNEDLWPIYLTTRTRPSAPQSYEVSPGLRQRRAAGGGGELERRAGQGDWDYRVRTSKPSGGRS